MKKKKQATTSGRKSSEYIVWISIYHKGDIVCDRRRMGEDGKHPFDCFIEDMGRRLWGRQRFMTRTGMYNKEDCYRLDSETQQIMSDLRHRFSLMKARCNNKNAGNYSQYGAKGIRVLWDNVDEFIQDTIDIYRECLKIYPNQKLFTDRIDNSLGYQKGNVRFVPLDVSNANKTNTVLYGEEKIYIPDLSKKTGISYDKIQYRLLNGLDIYSTGRKDNHILEYNGKKQAISVRAKELGLGWSTIYNRLQKGRPIEKVLSSKKIPGSREMKQYSIGEFSV